MTALASRRRSHTVRGAAIVAGALVVAMLLTAGGVATLARSTIGAEVETGAAVSPRLPFTATAFIGLVDDDGVLRSAAMLVLDPDGIGGSIVPVEATADIASNRAVEVIPLAAGLASGGVDLLRLDAESLTGVSFDLVTVLDASEFAELLEPIGLVNVELETGVSDDSTGRRWSAGAATLAPESVAALLVTHADGVESASLARLRAEIWDGIAAAVGDGLDSLKGVFVTGELDPRAVPATIRSFWRRLLAGEIGSRPLRVEPLAPERVPTGTEVTFHDWSETLLVSAHVAPTRVAAPLDAATVRLVVPFGLDDSVAADLTPTDIAISAIDRMVLAGLNVISVSVAFDGSSSVTPPEATQVWVGDEARVTDAAASFALLVGDVTALVGDYRIDGVDVIIVLGRDFIDDLDRDIRPFLEGSIFEADRG